MRRSTMNSFRNPAFFHQLFQGIPEAVVILDSDDRVVVVNQQFETFFGYDAEAARGRPINDLVVPKEYLQEGIRCSSMVLEGTPINKMSSIRCRADGTRVNVSITARPIYLEGRQAGIVVMYRDISDQVILLDSIDTQLWYLKDPDTYGAVNDAHARFTGHLKMEMENRRLEEIFDPDEARELKNSNRDVFERGFPTTIERWARRADGEKRLLRIRKNPRFDAPGQIRYVVCSAEDITQTRERENQLRLLSSMVEQSADPMVRTDADYRITYMNPAAERHYGCTLEEVHGSSPGIFNAEENAVEIQREIESTIRAGHVYEGRVRNRRKDGTTFMAQLRIAPITDDEGAIIGFVGIQRDITEQQRELETKELLLREVQHRVKNNLATVVSLLTLQTAGLNEPVAVDALNDVRRRIEAMLTVYETLHVSAETGTIDLGSYLEDLIKRLQETLDSRNPISFYNETGAVPINSSSAISVGMIVNELLTNAVKHAFPDERAGTIYVTITGERSNPTDSGERQCRIIIADDGVSIPEDVHASGTGGGLGLTLVRSLVSKLRGSLDLERDGGTRFTLRFPQ